MGYIYLFLFFIFLYTSSFASDFRYTFGRGLFIDNRIWLGGYISASYWNKEGDYRFSFDDIAFLSRFFMGNLSLFSELEAKNIYTLSHSHKNRYWNFKFEIERLFLEYKKNEYINLKIGRFLTPLGIWNKIHIDALKWTASDPLVSTSFFPMFTTGIELSGFIKNGIKYELFIQKNESINSSYNNLQTEDMIGFQLEKIKNLSSRYGINVGRFDEKVSNERYTFVGLYGKTKIKGIYISSEFFYAHEKFKGEKKHKEYGKITYYFQGVYRLFSKNYLVFRKDGLYDSSDDKRIDIWTFCWNFRPRFNISFKAEYQIFEKENDIYRFSFSLLF